MQIEIQFGRRSARLSAEDIAEARDWFRRFGRSAATLDKARDQQRVFADAMTRESDIGIFDAVTGVLSDAELAAIIASDAAKIDQQMKKLHAMPAWDYSADRGDVGSGYGRHTNED